MLIVGLLILLILIAFLIHLTWRAWRSPTRLGVVGRYLTPLPLLFLIGLLVAGVVEVLREEHFRTALPSEADRKRGEALGWEDGIQDAVAGLPRNDLRHNRAEALHPSDYQVSERERYSYVDGKNAYLSAYEKGWAEGALRRFKTMTWPKIARDYSSIKDHILKSGHLPYREPLKAMISYVDKNGSGYHWEFDVSSNEALFINDNDALREKYGMPLKKPK